MSPLDRAITARITCSMSRIVRPMLALSARNRATMWSVSVGRKPAITSSSMMTRGPVASARATSRRLRSGKGKRGGEGLTLFAQPQLIDDVPCLGLGRAHAGISVERTDDHILHHAEAGEGLYQLERAADAGAAYLVGPPAVDARAGKPHLAGIGPGDPGDHVKAGGLARSVGPDQADDGTLRHDEADVLQGA